MANVLPLHFEATFLEGTAVEGVLIADYDNDGRLDIFLTTFGLNDANLLYRNGGSGIFTEIGALAGLGSLPGQAFGAVAADLDNDGWLDVAVAHPIGTPNLLLHDRGEGNFTNIADNGGLGDDNSVFFGVGDYDGNGFEDLYQSNRSGSADLLYRNRGNSNHWLQVNLVGVQSNRSAIGALIRLHAGRLSMTRQINGGNGYGSGIRTASFGLGGATKADSVVVHWPSGRTNRLLDVPADQQIRIFEGRDTFHPIEPTVWEIRLPNSLPVNTRVSLRARVRPAQFEPGARVAQITADLSALGGSNEVFLQADGGEQAYDLEADITTVNTLYTALVRIEIEQTTWLGPYKTVLWHALRLVPAATVVGESKGRIPTDFGLYPNYPNPFNSGTVIPYALSHAQHAELTVYNLAGQQVAKLIDSRHQAGHYTIKWDGLDNNASELASGVYLYRLQAGSQVDTRKLLLVR
ncbi:MAG: T9SS type A sorting domain-containing protein [Candidatus Latescibacteria bacterium]|nr:T9SS type A sorting domain-containing protein [Candidatus Latescibacterota bacterium]